MKGSLFPQVKPLQVTGGSERKNPLGSHRPLLDISDVKRTLSSLLLSLLPLTGAAETWNQFRGPGGSGVAAEGSAPPVTIAQSNLAWKAPVGTGLSAPVLSKTHVYLTAIENDRFFTLAFDKKTGKEVWRKEGPKVPLERVHKANTPASPSVLVDDKGLYVYFGSYGLIAYDHQGERRWVKPIATPRSLYGTSTSPIAHGEHIILVVDNDENIEKSRLSKSKIYCFKKENGDIAWEAQRPFVRSGWSTPTIWRHKDGEELVVLGSGRVDSYDLKNGEEKWFTKGFSRETIAVPVQGNGQVYISSAQLGGVADDKIDPEPFWQAMLRFDANKNGAFDKAEITEHFSWVLRPELPLGHPGFGLPLPRDPENRKRRQEGIFRSIDKNKDGKWTKEEYIGHMSNRRGRPILMAISPGGKGDIKDTNVTWELNRSIPEVPSPIFYQDQIYLVRNGGILAAVETKKGKQLYRGRLGSTGGYSASPVAANGHLYLLSDEGVISVVKAGKQFELVHKFQLSEPATVTPALDQNTIYVRGEKHLWAYRK